MEASTRPNDAELLLLNLLSLDFGVKAILLYFVRSAALVSSHYPLGPYATCGNCIAILIWEVVDLLLSLPVTLIG